MNSSSSRFDWSFIALSVWFVTGAYMDGWAHNHIPELETFFSPWHAVLYSGFFALAAYLVIHAWKGHRQGTTWWRALPAGYSWSLVGIDLFLAGGVLDMTWHLIFGVESSVDALLSPTHLLLATGGVLMVLGPARSYWHAKRTHQHTGALKEWAAVLSLVFAYSIMTFMGQFAHPANVLAAGVAPADLDTAHDVMSWGVSSIILMSALFMGFILTFIRFAKLPFGALTVFFGLNALAMGIMRDSAYLVPGAVLAGLIADKLAQQFKPELLKPSTFRLFAAAVPMVVWSAYFLSLLLSGRTIWWSVHLWTGSIVISGIFGLLMSYMVLAPGKSEEK